MQLEVTYRGVVYPWHCDHMGHMNVMWYTGKFDEASWSLLASAGLTRSFLTRRGHGLAAVQQDITYKRELKAGDIVSVQSGILDVQDKIIRIFHEMRNEETREVSAFATITGVYMDVNVRRAIQIPIDVAEHIKTMRLDDSRLYWTDTLPSIPKPCTVA
jgi:acyl-CoA thioester hydrolase